MAISTPIRTPQFSNSAGLDSLIYQTKKFGGLEGAKRLEFIRSQQKQLTPYTAHLLLNPEAIQEEIEQAQINRRWIHVIHYARNFLSLAPLIVTWFGLFDAVSAYQNDLASNPLDNIIPFLQLWQSGFHGYSRFPFSAIAITDVVLLSLYLFSLIAIHFVEQKAHTFAIDFIDSQAWRSSIQSLMDEIEEASKPFIADKSDIETVVGSVKKIVDDATISFALSTERIANKVSQATEKIVADHHQILEDTKQSTQEFIEQVVRALKQIATATEQNVSQTFELSKQAIITSNTRVESLFEKQVKQLIETFNRDIQALQREIHNYQGRLDALTKASQQLAGSSSQLANASDVLQENAERYILIGEDLKAQIAALSIIQQDMLSQFGGVASNISAASGNMTDTQTHMVAAIHEVTRLTGQLEQEMERAVGAIATRIERTSQSLEGITRPLQLTSQSLQRVIPPLETSSQSFQRVIAPLSETAERLQTASHELASIRFFPFVARRKRPPKQGRVS